MDEDTEAERKVGPVEEGGDDEEERDEGGGVEEEKEKGEDRVAVLQHCTSVFLDGQWIKILMMKVNEPRTHLEGDGEQDNHDDDGDGRCQCAVDVPTQLQSAK